MIFYCDGEALKVVRKYRCHPVVVKMIVSSGMTYCYFPFQPVMFAAIDIALSAKASHGFVR
jgi:hypothetical protein